MVPAGEQRNYKGAEGGQGRESQTRDRVRGREVEAGTTENSCRDLSRKGEQGNREVVGRGRG